MNFYIAEKTAAITKFNLLFTFCTIKANILDNKTGWLPGTERIPDGSYFSCGEGREVFDTLFHTVYDDILVAMEQTAD